MERRAHADRCEDLPSALPDDMGELFHLLEPLFFNGDSAVSLRFDDRGNYHLLPPLALPLICNIGKR